VDAGQERAADPAMSAARLARQLSGRRVVETGHDQHLIAKGSERRQDWRQLERRAGFGRRPVCHHRAVRNVDDAEPTDRLRRRRVRRGKRRHHSIEERQGYRGTESAEHGPSRNRFLRDDHGSDLLI
jgi:hypothetical protein